MWWFRSKRPQATQYRAHRLDISRLRCNILIERTGRRGHDITVSVLSGTPEQQAEVGLVTDPQSNSLVLYGGNMYANRSIVHLAHGGGISFSQTVSNSRIEGGMAVGNAGNVYAGNNGDIRIGSARGVHFPVDQLAVKFSLGNGVEVIGG